MEITFLGATNTVTGSKYLVRTEHARVLVDCGLFQGFKQLRLRNWNQLPVNPREVDAVVLTHAHIDHTGYLPLFVKNGFSGPVYCTPATRDLCAIMLPDAGHLQEEEARYANKRGTSKHHPAQPLYTREDAVASLERLEPVDFYRDEPIATGTRFRFTRAGHILGAAHVELTATDGGRETTLAFSGDVGRPNDVLMFAPDPIERADYLVVESTYGNRKHEATDPADTLADVIKTTAGRGGVVLVPAFAVGRAQSILWLVHLLKRDGRIPDIPVFLDSPMAIEATGVMVRHCGEHRLSGDDCRALAQTATCVTTVEESKRVSASSGPMIVISASGMATGGRVLHHLKAFAPNPTTTVLFAGYQAGGTRGADLIAGESELKIFGEFVPVRAEVKAIDNLSAHADAGEMIDWLRKTPKAPRRTFVTHGEPTAAEAFRKALEQKLGWRAEVPDYRETVEL